MNRRFGRIAALAAAAAALVVAPSFGAGIGADAAAPANPLPASPFEQPSAAGEQLLLEQAGLVAPNPERAHRRRRLLRVTRRRRRHRA